MPECEISNKQVANVPIAIQPEVVEISYPLTANMKSVQSAILVAMEGCLKELRKGLPTLDPTVLSLENAIFKNFGSSF